MKGRILEICCAEIGAVSAALEGAHAASSSAAASPRGMTPSLGLIRGAAALGMPEINVLIRPRPGDFLYSEAELRVMEEDIRLAVEAGATGIVTGALTAEGDIDTVAVRRLIAAGRAAADKVGGKRLNVTFHRAFDVCRDPETALEDIIALGCDCLLSSGQQATAELGIPLLKKIVSRAGGRIAVIAGSGVNPGNAAKILAETGADGIHSTARELTKSPMRFRNKSLTFDEDRPATTAKIVSSLLSKA